ncbi:MAG: hypothetical protein ACKOFW_22065, partial [Planctomycetaceae bacterium]
LDPLNNHADVERWWRHSPNRFGRKLDATNPPRPNRKQAIMMLIFSVVVIVSAGLPPRPRVAYGGTRSPRL